MSWSACPALFADVGPGPPFGYPAEWSVSVRLAGVFLSLAFVTGGLWLVRHLQNRPAPAARHWFLLALSGLGWCGAVFFGVAGLYYFPPLWAAAVGALAVGIQPLIVVMRGDEPELTYGALARGAGTVVLCGVAFAFLGGLVAAGLNEVAPGYSRVVFVGPWQFEGPAQAGVSAGNRQGLLLGLTVGAVLAVGLGSFNLLRPAPLARALAVVALCGLAFALAGTAIGYGLGTFAPDYYRGVFRDGQRSDFNPVDVGIGLGCTQGLVLGVALGTAAALAGAWRRSRAGTAPPGEGA
jgi:hypothetical protein